MCIVASRRFVEVSTVNKSVARYHRRDVFLLSVLVAYRQAPRNTCVCAGSAVCAILRQK